MAQFSDEERESILAESFDTLERLERSFANDAPAHNLPPAEDRLDRWQREAAERQERAVTERESRKAAETEIVRKSSAMDAATQAQWDHWCDARIKTYVRELIPEVIALERKDTEAKLTGLRAEFELKLDALRAEISRQRAIDAKVIVDLPALPLRRAAQ